MKTYERICNTVIYLPHLHSFYGYFCGTLWFLLVDDFREFRSTSSAISSVPISVLLHGRSDIYVFTLWHTFIYHDISVSI